MMAIRLPLRLPALVVLALPLAPAAAFAASASISQQVDMRSGPAASYGVVGQLQRGDGVDVRQCEGTFCEVTFNGKSGWVSATYLTRDAVPPAGGQTPAQPRVATVAPPRPTPAPEPKAATPAEPQLASDMPPKTTPTPAPEIVAPAEPKIASIPPSDAGKPVLPTTAPKPRVADVPMRKPASPKPKAVVTPPPAYAEIGRQGQVPADAAPAIVPEVAPMPGPRPKVDIPGGPGRDYAYDSPPPANRDFQDGYGDGPQVIGPVPSGSWHRRVGRDFAGIAPGGRHACFVDENSGTGFCVREGDQIVAPRRWASRSLSLRNPQGLNVIVCAEGGSYCHRYDSGSRLLLGGRGIASIVVAAPGY